MASEISARSLPPYISRQFAEWRVEGRPKQCIISVILSHVRAIRGVLQAEPRHPENVAILKKQARELIEIGKAERDAQ